MAFLSRIPSSARTTAWIVGSCCVHVAAVLVLGSQRPHPAPPVVVPVEFEIETTSEPEQAEPTAAVPGDPAAPATATLPSERHANAVVPSQDTGPAQAEAAPVASGSSWSVSAFKSGPVAILPPTDYAAMPALSAAPRPEPVAPGQVSQTGGLRDALAAKDTALGLGRGGAAVSAAHQASNEAPSSGRLVLSLTFDASGAATSVQIGDRSDPDPTWDSYARAVLALAKKKPARALPEGAKGMVVTMSVESRMVLPSGSDPGSSTKVDGLSGSFDLGDVGAAPKKRVTARILKEAMVY